MRCKGRFFFQVGFMLDVSKMGLLDELKGNHGFELGTPWKLTERHVTAVIPIIKIGAAGNRAYVLVEEVKEKIRVVDAGNIGSVKMIGFEGPVLVRSGVVIEGIKTQSRTVEFSTIITPQSVKDVRVRCVHASHPISPGASMRIAGIYAPAEVHSALLESSMRNGGQHDVWNAVRMYHARASTSPQAGTVNINAKSDDLVQTVLEVNGFRRDLDHLVSKMPVDVLGQVGIVVIGVKGVLGLEMFDHPESWTAASKAVARRYADLLEMEGESSLFELRIDAVKEHVMKFLNRTIHASEKIVHEDFMTRTVAFQTKDVLGERVSLDGKEIYLIASSGNSIA